MTGHELTVAAVHDAVREVERLMRTTWPDLALIIGHAEPSPKMEVNTTLRA